MQDRLSVLPFVVSLFMAILVMSSHAEKEKVIREWSTLLDPETPLISGFGSWRARFNSDSKGPLKTWHKSEKARSASERKFDDTNNLQLIESGSNDIQYGKKMEKNFKDQDLDFVLKTNEDNETKTVYDNWVGSKNEDDIFLTPNYSQPSWQLPVLNVNVSEKQYENITVFPLSLLHRFLQKTKHIRRIDEFDNNNLEFDNEKFYEIGQVTEDQQLMAQCKNGCLSEREINDSLKGDLQVIESRGMEWSGGGGGMKGQPILLIKDKGDSGGDMSGHTANGKDGLAPLIMMLTPLIMMCIMMPMMMSAMAGMMNFMKSMAQMMMMMTWPQSQTGMQQALVTKHRKSDEDDQMQPNDILISFINELSERLELAINKYSD